MGLSNALSAIVDFLNDSATPPGNRLDAAIKDLEKYYTAVGNENMTTGYALDDSLTPTIGQIADLISSKLGDQEETADLDSIRYMRSLINGGEEGAYFAQDILSLAEKNLGAIAPASLLNIFGVRYEKWASPSSPVNATVNRDEGVGLREQTASTELLTTQQTQVSGSSDTQNLEEVSALVPGLGNIEGASPDRVSNPQLSALTINDIRLSPANRRTTAASIFFNSIPTIEMSQCSPFLKLTFVSEFDKFITGMDKMSLFGFVGENPSESLVGTIQNNQIDFSDFVPEDIGHGGEYNVEKSVTAEIFSANSAEGGYAGDARNQEVAPAQLAAAGIELFQMPQTLNNLGYNQESSGIIDPSVPLASLQRLSVNIAGLGLATLANKTATLEFILHDRSRMPLIAPLIAGNSFGGTYVVIEYGWMHNQATGATVGNVYADFLNSLRDRAVFNIQVANTTILNDGQVKVQLRLASRGSYDMNNLPVGSGVKNVPASLLAPFFEKILEATARAKSGVVSAELDQVEQIGGLPLNTEALNRQLIQINSGFRAQARSLGSPRALIPIDSYQALLIELRKPLGAGDQGATQAAVGLMQTMIDGMDAVNQSEQRYSTLRSEIAKKKDTLTSLDIFNDGIPTEPSLRINQAVYSSQGVEEIGSITLEGNNAGSASGPTLGSILLTFVGRTLSSTMKYDEVQFIFYPFNSQAGLMADVNCAHFFCNGFDDFIGVVEEDKPFSSINQFMDDLFNDKCGPENPRHPQFGLEQVYEEFSAEEEAINNSSNDPDSTITTEDRDDFLVRRRSAIEDRLNAIYNSETQSKQPTFVPPDMTVMMECLPAMERASVNGKERYIVSATRTVLRVHVFDAKAGLPFECELLQQLITQGSVANEIQPQSPVVGEGERQQSKAAAALSGFSNRLRDKMSTWIDSDSLKVSQPIVLEGTPQNPRTAKSTVLSYISNVPVREIKNAIKSVTPSITFGAMFTNLDSISMSSNTSGAVNQVLLLNAVDGDGDTPDQEQQTNVVEDVFIIPTNATISAMGFPLAQYGQKFYIDMGTGTTADNFYYVVGISHTITPGAFKTQLTCAYNSSATINAIRNSLETAINAKYGE